MRLRGHPLELRAHPAESRTNRQFSGHALGALDVVYLPRALSQLLVDPPVSVEQFIEDDNRGAIRPDPVATLDGVEFYLSVKGVGSATDPYSWRPLDRWYAAELTDEPEVKAALRSEPPDGSDRLITGELWLRGSPYGGQGIEHATTALGISERADLTSIDGFLIAPVVKVCLLPEALETHLRRLNWYRQYRGRMVQELRLVPSNVRVYFHARSTLGTDVRQVFDLFAIDSDGKAWSFEVNFLRTTVAMLTLFARSMEAGPVAGTYRGLDFYDVWLDKDAVLAPNGSVYFVDLEGIETVSLPRESVKEKLEDQVYRSLYELTFGYEQIEAERRRRFGGAEGRTERFARVLRAALHDDRFVRLRESGSRLDFEIRNKHQEEALYLTFPAVDR
jgi:hypothetical protein